MSGLLIMGAGGHGRVVAFTARRAGAWSEIAFLDDRYPGVGSVDGHPVLGGFAAASELADRFSDAAIALGENLLRLDAIKQLLGSGYRLPVIAHPTAAISDHAELGAGSVVFAQTVIHPGTTIGRGCIVNTAATIDHDCIIGDAVHLSPGVHLGGGVRVGDLSWLGVGVSVKNGVTIGSRSTVGVGAAVIGDLPDDVTAVGVPAQIVDSTVENS